MEKSIARTFRLVCTAGQVGSVEALLASEGFAFEAEPFDVLARRLKSEPFPLGASLAACFGLIYIQDRSSMLPPLCLAPPAGSVVLDLCASPGSKTGLLARLVGNTGLVVGNEPNPKRLATLRQNLQVMNLANVVTTTMKGEGISLPDGNWPYVLVDAPCSGWGTVERNPRVLALWQGDKVEPLIRLQRDLLARAARLLSPGGRLVYSTCTTNPAENEEQVRFAVEELGLEPYPLNPAEGFVFEKPASGDTGILTVAGEASGAQGFFVAGLARPGSSEHQDTEKLQDGQLPGEEVDAAVLKDVSGLTLAHLPPGSFRSFKGRVFFVPHLAARFLAGNIRWQGLPVGRLQGGRFRPDPRSRVLLPPSSKEGLSFTEPDGLRGLLSGQSLTLDRIPKISGLYWHDVPLGWLTIKGKRALWSGK